MTSKKEPKVEPGRKTGWPDGLLQDDCKALSKWFASKPDARRLVRERVAEILAMRDIQERT